MKKSTKSVLSLTLCIMMMFGMVTLGGDGLITAFAYESGECGENLTWVLDDEGTLTISGTGKMNCYNSPNDTPWYTCSDSIKNVVIGDAVTSIGDDSFKGCTGLESINIPDSVTFIGAYAFEGCSGLKSIEIPASVTNIDFAAFNGCTGLENITVDEENAVYDSRNGCNAIIATISSNLFFGCNNTIIPADITGINMCAFAGCKGLKSAEIPDGVISICMCVFEDCTGLTSVVIPASVTSIGDDAFKGCTSLTDVYYGGTESDKTEIEIREGNDCLKNIEWHCGYGSINGLEKPIIAGNSKDNQMTYAYKTTVTFKAKVPDAGSVQWYIDGEKAGTGETLTVPAKTKSYTVTVVITDSDGEKTFDEEEVTIKNSFFDIVVYFFKHLFNPPRIHR